MAYMTDTTTHGIAIAEETHLTQHHQKKMLYQTRRIKRKREEETEVVPPLQNLPCTSHRVFNNCVFKP